eukprot:3822513-Pyramimonas_sp.AAC.1
MPNVDVDIDAPPPSHFPLIGALIELQPSLALPTADPNSHLSGLGFASKGTHLERELWELAAMAPKTIAVVANSDHPALKVMLSDDNIKFLIAKDMDTFSSYPELDKVEGIVWIPPGNVATLEALYEKVP